MGRAGVTLGDIENAAMQLQGRGKQPTVDGIRELLGTGSKSTIIQHLKTWKSKQNESQGNLPQELLSVVAGLWERVSETAEQRLIDRDEVHQEEKNAFQREFNELQQAQNSLKSQFQALEVRFANEEQAKKEGERILRELQEEHMKLVERYEANLLQLDHNKEENTRLHALATHIQANFEHYQEATQKARTEQTLLMEKQQHQFQQERSELQRELAAQRQQYHHLEQQQQLTMLECKHIKQQHEALNTQHDALTKQHQTVTHDCIILQERDEKNRAQLEKYQQDFALLNQQNKEQGLQVAILSDQEKRLQQALSQAEDKIETLRQEKLFISQDLLVLQHHVKQLEK